MAKTAKLGKVTHTRNGYSVRMEVKNLTDGKQQPTGAYHIYAGKKQITTLNMTRDEAIAMCNDMTTEPVGNGFTLSRDWDEKGLKNTFTLYFPDGMEVESFHSIGKAMTAYNGIIERKPTYHKYWKRWGAKN